MRFKIGDRVHVAGWSHLGQHRGSGVIVARHDYLYLLTAGPHQTSNQGWIVDHDEENSRGHLGVDWWEINLALETPPKNVAGAEATDPTRVILPVGSPVLRAIQCAILNCLTAAGSVRAHRHSKTILALRSWAEEHVHARAAATVRAGQDVCLANDGTEIAGLDIDRDLFDALRNAFPTIPALDQPAVTTETVATTTTVPSLAILCGHCSVDGVRVARRVRGEIRIHYWACGCKVEPTSIDPPGKHARCACGAEATTRVDGPFSRIEVCGDCASDSGTKLANIVPLYVLRPYWSVRGHGAAAHGPTAQIATERWREGLVEAQRAEDA